MRKPMRRKGDDQEPTESPGCWDPGGSQVVRWPAEGAAKGKPSMLQRVGYVSRRRYAGISQSARGSRETRWYRG